MPTPQNKLLQTINECLRQQAAIDLTIENAKERFENAVVGRILKALNSNEVLTTSVGELDWVEMREKYRTPKYKIYVGDDCEGVPRVVAGNYPPARGSLTAWMPSPFMWIDEYAARLMLQDKEVRRQLIARCEPSPEM